MSKKFRNKLCVYCSNADSNTADHVFAREFFLIADRKNLPKVPACSICNGNKSKLEHYAVSILPFGGRHRSAKANLETMVPKRLRKNAALHRTLDAGRGRVWVKDGPGLIQPTMSIPIDAARLKSLFEYVAKGLIWHHFEARLADTDELCVFFLTIYGDQQFRELVFDSTADERIQVNLGNDTVLYEGIRYRSCPKSTAWRISMFGGIALAGEGTDTVSHTIGFMTFPKGSMTVPESMK